MADWTVYFACELELLWSATMTVILLQYPAGCWKRI